MKIPFAVFHAHLRMRGEIIVAIDDSLLDSARNAQDTVKVFAADGSEVWVLVHVEVQGEAEEAFARRMYARKDAMKASKARYGS